MFNLIIKDINIQKKDKTVWIFILLSILNVFIYKKNYSLSILLTFISVYLLVIYANAYDFKYNSEMLINSLPIRKSFVVIAKYLSVFLFLFCSIALTFILEALIGLLNKNSINGTIVLNTVFIDVFIVSIYYAILFPIYYKVGYLKSRWVNFIAMGLIGALIALVNEAANGTKSANPLQSIYSNFNANGVLLQDCLLLCISILFIVISLFVSINIYRNKEV